MIDEHVCVGCIETNRKLDEIRTNALIRQIALDIELGIKKKLLSFVSEKFKSKIADWTTGEVDKYSLEKTDIDKFVGDLKNENKFQDGLKELSLSLNDFIKLIYALEKTDIDKFVGDLKNENKFQDGLKELSLSLNDFIKLIYGLRDMKKAFTTDAHPTQDLSGADVTNVTRKTVIQHRAGTAMDTRTLLLRAVDEFVVDSA